MMDIDGMIDAIIDREGGYVNHPDDRGGATHWGITEHVARAHGYRGAMPALPRSAAVHIYRRIYWERPMLDRVANRTPHLAQELFDTAVNMGVSTAIGFFQRALNALNRQGQDYPDIRVDRRIGAQTLAALDAFITRRGSSGEAILVKAVEALQGARYISLAEQRPANESFLYGWISNRIGS